MVFDLKVYSDNNLSPIAENSSITFFYIIKKAIPYEIENFHVKIFKRSYDRSVVRLLYDSKVKSRFDCYINNKLFILSNFIDIKNNIERKYTTSYQITDAGRAGSLFNEHDGSLFTIVLKSQVRKNDWCKYGF